MGCTTFEIGLQFPWLCTARGGSQYIFTEFSQHCNATCSTVILFGWGLCSALHWSSSEDFRGECWTALFADTSSTWTPLVCHSHPPVSSYFCQHSRFIYFFHFLLSNCFFPLNFFSFSICVQFSIVMQALLLNPPQPPFPDLPGFLPGIITFFQGFFQQFLQHFFEKSLLLRFLSTIHSRFLWGIISFFSRYRKQECLILTKFLFHFLPPGTSLEISLKANVDSKWD